MNKFLWFLTACSNISIACWLNNMLFHLDGHRYVPVQSIDLRMLVYA